MRAAFPSILLVLALANAACRSTAVEETTSTSAAAGSAATTPAQPAVINTVCPIMGGPVKSSITTAHEGHVIGLCCSDCIAEWDALSAAERDAFVQESLGG